jgi:NADH:ubiquinone oxidoreductase subunit C
MNSYIITSIPQFTHIAHQLTKYKTTNYDQSIYLGTNNDLNQKVLTFLFLDLNTQAKVYTDLAVMDYPDKPSRFHVTNNILSIHYSMRYIVHFFVDELSTVQSSTDLFPAANWFEREAWDMFGIHFTGHKDLRRILTDYGFTGHPLRKDFPLSGYSEVYYNSRVETIIHEPLSLIQEFRTFTTTSPWAYNQLDIQENSK